MKDFLVVIVFVIFSTASFTQDCDSIRVSGKVIDTLGLRMFNGMMIFNQTTSEAKYASVDGSFEIYASPGDRIIVKVKSKEKYFLTAKADSQCEQHISIYTDLRQQEFNTVVIYPLKTLEEIKEKREELKRENVLKVTGLQVLKSPITALYERFSKKGKSKQKIAEMEFQDNKEKVLKELLRIYVSYDFVELTEEEFLGFIRYLDIDDAFLKSVNDYTLAVHIKNVLQAYKEDVLNDKD